MVQKSGDHQLRLVVNIPLFTRFFSHHPRWWFLAGFLVAINVVSPSSTFTIGAPTPPGPPPALPHAANEPVPPGWIPPAKRITIPPCSTPWRRGKNLRMIKEKHAKQQTDMTYYVYKHIYIYICVLYIYICVCVIYIFYTIYILYTQFHPKVKLMKSILKATLHKV